MLPHHSIQSFHGIFLLTGCLKALLRHTPAKSSRFQGQDNFPVITSTRKVAEERSIKMEFSYNIHHNNNNNILSYDNFSDGFSLEWFYEKKKSTVSWLCALAIVFS